MSIKKIVEALSQLQEGYLEEMKLVGDSLNIKVECKHLSDILDPAYVYFYVVLKGAKEVYFLPWDDEEMQINSLREIQLFKLDILNVENVEDKLVKIYSNCENVYSGGCLYIQASDIIVYDEGLNEVKLEELIELSDKYWLSSDKAEG